MQELIHQDTYLLVYQKFEMTPMPNTREILYKLQYSHKNIILKLSTLI